MKVLKNNHISTTRNNATIQNAYPRKAECEWCGSELEYDESDIRIGYLGLVFIDCPCCGSESIIDGDEHELRLSVSNIEFPTHFHLTSKETGAKECKDEYVKKCINMAVKFFRENKEEKYWFTQSGDSRIAVIRYSGDEVYEICVSNRFYTSEIPFEHEDY